jgi:hypothetical protein
MWPFGYTESRASSRGGFEKEEVMRDDFTESDPKTIWENQPTEPIIMTMDKIRQKARELRAKTRRQLLGNLAMLLIVVAFSGYGIIHFPVLQPLFAFAIAWGLVGLFFLNRGMWSTAWPGDAGLSTGLEFCRQEIGRLHSLSRRVLVWSFGPVLLAIGAFILALAKSGEGGRGIFPKAMPFIAVVIIWVAVFFVVRMREQRRLQREADELDYMENENGR